MSRPGQRRRHATWRSAVVAALTLATAGYYKLRSRLSGKVLELPNAVEGGATNRLVGWATQGGGITGGGSASAVTVNSASSLTSAVSGTNAAVIRVSGTISCSGMIRVGSNKSILGNSGAVISGCGLNVSEASNVIIRNITFRNWNDDAVNVQYSTRVWIDHNSFSNGEHPVLVHIGHR